MYDETENVCVMMEERKWDFERYACTQEKSVPAKPISPVLPVLTVHVLKSAVC